MTIVAKAYQIVVIKCKFRVLFVMLDMVNNFCFSLSAISLTALTLIAVTSEDSRTLALPSL